MADGLLPPSYQHGTISGNNDNNNNSNSVEGARTTVRINEAAVPTRDLFPSNGQSVDIIGRNEENEVDENNDDELESNVDGGGTSDEEDIVTLARRLRCMFGIVTWPIVPLGTIAVLALLYLLYAAFVLRNDGTIWKPHGGEAQEPCAHPLHAFAWASLLLACYTPNHKSIRRHLFRGETGRPPMVRRCDQIFHTLALLYVYAGITLVQACREDSLDATGQELTNRGTTNEKGDTVHMGMNTCQATCPVLTDAVTLYVATLELFTLSLILPLLFLPCIYLWFLRQATANQASLAELQQRLREGAEDDDDDFVFDTLTGAHGGGRTIPAHAILSQQIAVILVKQQQQQQQEGNQDENDKSSTKVSIIPTDPEIQHRWDAKDGSRECCICMSEFYIHDENGDTNIDIETATVADDQEVIVRTPICGHLFHEQCITNWVRGRWEEQHSTRTLLRQDVGISINEDTERNGTQSATENGDIPVADSRERYRHRQRRARRTTCPLCRADLWCDSGGHSQYSTF